MKKIVHCQECSKETTNPKFCSSSCAATFHNKNRIEKCPNKDKTKTINCKECGNVFEVNIRDRSIKTCDHCVILYKRSLIKENKKTKSPIRKKVYTRIKICKTCGSADCKKVSICSKRQIVPTLIKYFGFNSNLLGTSDVFREYEQIKTILNDDYHKLKLSIPDLCKKYNHNDFRNFAKIIKSLGIVIRTRSESRHEIIKSGKPYNLSNVTRSDYKHGWHKTWEGKDIFYRSSYEFEYIQILDKNKISYDVECLRIEYWDSQELKYRIAIPDFHLSETNTIVEIKSTYFYDPINMKDKFVKYKELGYNFKLILDKIEYLEPIMVN